MKKNLNLKENPVILAKRRYAAEHIVEVDPENRKIKFGAFMRKYGRIIIGGVIIAVVLFCAIFAPMLTQWDPDDTSPRNKNLKPGTYTQLDENFMHVHIFGTDAYGRDIWSRMIFGSRNTLIVSLGAQIIMTVSGTLLGLLCGYYTKVEKYLMRVLDATATIPSLLLCLLMVSVFGSGIPNLMVAMSFSGIPGLARMIRNQVLSLREKEYIESEKAMGATDLRTVSLHILPACSSYLLVRFSSGLAGAILTMTALSYLGVGLDPTVASWGGMVQNAQESMMVHFHTFLFPTAAIAITVFGFTMLGDGLRDLLDPKLR